jgi:dTDP-4-dehydrorhamnose reductase
MLKLGRAQPSVAVVNDQTGCPTYTVDLAAAVLELLQSKARGVYHRTNAGEVTWHDFAQEIYRLAKMETVVTPLTTAELARPAPRPQYSTLHSTKLAPLRPWQAALADYLTQIL